MRWIDDTYKPSNVGVFQAAGLDEAIFHADRILSPDSPAQVAVWRMKGFPVPRANPLELAAMPYTRLNELNKDCRLYIHTESDSGSGLDWNNPVLNANGRLELLAGLKRIFGKARYQARLERANPGVKHLDMHKGSILKPPDESRMFSGRELRITVAEEGEEPESGTWIYDPMEMAPDLRAEFYNSIYDANGRAQLAMMATPHGFEVEEFKGHLMLETIDLPEPWAPYPGDLVFMPVEVEAKKEAIHSSPKFERESFEHGRILNVYDCKYPVLRSEYASLS